ncbi:MAG: uracil-DNA glycosylase family protein [Novosphingobium sp.]
MPDILLPSDPLAALLRDIGACSLCTDLPLGPKPLLQAGRSARILLAGQAPGRRTHAAAMPFADASGERLRDWLGIDRKTFYDPARIAILPMAFCYPGTGSGGDLAPPPLCAESWRERLLEHLPDVELTVLIGAYAQQWHLGRDGSSLTDRVRNWRAHWPAILPLPHPSPRNNRWLAQNPWFEVDLLPVLRARVAELV